MITTENLAQVLTALDFTPARGKYSKTFDFPTKQVKITVDITNQKIIYPDEIRMDRKTTINFSDNENFVVLEYVNRLLDKGYKPEHIYLEKAYKTGVGSSPLAHKDIQVCDNKGNPYFVIECKTAPEKGKTSSKFLGEWNRMQNSGGQLFAYYQQDRTIKFIALYTSDFTDGKVTYENKIIKLEDNKKYLKENNFTKSYETAKNQDDIFSVWKDIYKSDFSDTGIFEDEIACYQVGYLKPTINTLKTIDNAYSQKQRHEWATILRANSVGDRGVALNKLMNLFLCKVTDELENPNSLSFTWKGYTADTPFDLVDRLQKLYQIGMKNYLKKEITYYSKQEINQAFGEFFSGIDIQNKIENIFNDLKYFQNGDFNFIEVYNKELFNENFEILLSVVRSLEKVKFTQNENANILGDFFETYIHDLPQQEGQYFTPTSLVDFIIYSLPVFKNNKVLDFACGAGHFLTQFFNRNKGSNSEFLGVEKDTRLAKISTIATFMNEINQKHCEIKSANALSQDEIKNHSVNVIISNPPYSVKGFLEVLDEKDRKKFTLFNDKIDIESNNSIECFFVEKTSQALQENGVLAIVLPSSLLQKTDELYIATRKILIRDFHIVGICELSNKAFYKAGVNVCIVFAIRKPVQNDKITHINDTYLDIYKLILQNQYGKAKYAYSICDKLVEKYCQFRSFELSEFIKLLELTVEENSTLFNNEDIKEYCKYYNENIYQKELEKYNEKTDRYKLNNSFIPSIDINNFIRNKECEKFLYFCYAQQSNPIIIKSPTDNKGQEEFLGYKWSERKGQEGLQELSKTSLFNKNNRFDNTKLSFYLLQQFIHQLNHQDIDDSVLVHFQNNEYLSIPNELQQYAKQIDLINMIDFSKVDFDLSISTSMKNKTKIESKYPLVKISNLLEKLENTNKKVETDNILENGKYPVISQNTTSFIDGYSNDEPIKLTKPIILFGDHTCCFKYIDFDFLRGADGTQILNFRDEINVKFAYFAMQKLQIQNSNKYERHFKYLKDIKIPLPPLEIQQQIVAECESVDNQIQTLNNEIEELQQQSQQLINGVNAPLKPIKLIAEYTTERIAYKDTLPENYITTDNMLQKYAGITKYDGIPNIESAILYKENDILISNIRPYLRKIWFSNQTGCCSADILVVRTKENADCLSKYLFCCLRRDDFFDYSMQNVKGMKMPRGNKEHIMNYQIPLPAIETQQKIIAEFERLQQTIQQNEQQIATLKNEYNRILDKYLK